MNTDLLTIELLVFGLLIGSFLNVVTYRLPLGQSVVRPRSSCPSCKHIIRWYDNIPLFSWLFLRGRCRDCGQSVSVRYPLTELSTGLLFSAAGYVYGYTTNLLSALLLITLLVVVVGTDLEHRIIPNRVLLFMAPWPLVIALTNGTGSVADQLIAAAVSGGLFLLIALVYPAGMGMGDVKLISVLGLYLGAKVAIAITGALFVGSLVGVVLLVSKGREARKKALPFAPFLALGAVTALFWGDAMFNWYLDAFWR